MPVDKLAFGIKFVWTYKYQLKDADHWLCIRGGPIIHALHKPQHRMQFLLLLHYNCTAMQEKYVLKYTKIQWNTLQLPCATKYITILYNSKQWNGHMPCSGFIVLVLVRKVQHLLSICNFPLFTRPVCHSFIW